MVEKRMLVCTRAIVLFATTCAMTAALSMDATAELQLMPMGRYKLAYKFEPGQTMEYLITQTTSSTVSIPPQKGQSYGARESRTESQAKVWVISKVVRVTENGSAHILRKFANYQMDTKLGKQDLVVTATERGITKTLDGRMVVGEQPGGEEIPGMLTEDIHRRLFVKGLQIAVSTTGEEKPVPGSASARFDSGLDLMGLMGGALSLVFPERQMTVGSTWITEHLIELPDGNLKIEKKNLLEAVESVEGTRYARVNQALASQTENTSEAGNISVEGNVVYSFALDEGYLRQADFSIVQQVKLPGRGGSIRSKIRGKVEKGNL